MGYTRIKPAERARKSVSLLLALALLATPVNGLLAVQSVGAAPLHISNVVDEPKEEDGAAIVANIAQGQYIAGNKIIEAVVEGGVRSYEIQMYHADGEMATIDGELVRSSGSSLIDGAFSLEVDTSKLKDLSYYFVFNATTTLGDELPQLRIDVFVDNQTPSVPENGMPNNKLIKESSLYFKWDAATDNSQVIYELQRSTKNDVDENGSLVDAWNSISDGNENQRELKNPQMYSSSIADGLYYWQVRAVDEAGNKSSWSELWDMVVDTKKPTLEILQPEEGEVFGAPDKKTIRVEARLHDERGLGSYNIMIDAENADLTSDSSAEANGRYPGPVGLTVIAQLNADDFSDGQHVIEINVTDRAGNGRTAIRTIVIANTVVAPGGGEGELPPTPDESEKATDSIERAVKRLNRPFVPLDVPDISPVFNSITQTQDNEKVLGVQSKLGGDDVVSKVAAVPTEKGWELFGILWYWWLLFLSVATAIGVWLRHLGKGAIDDA